MEDFNKTTNYLRRIAGFSDEIRNCGRLEHEARILIIRPQYQVIKIREE
jgi:hypothetical protein